MIEPVVQEKSRKARKKTRLRWSYAEVRAHPGRSTARVRPQKPWELGRDRHGPRRAAVLEAAVDVPAEVVEGRRDDGDGEDVLHRRRHDVLAPRRAGLVRHEADVDQPHDHDGEEVELLGQDRRVEADLGADLLHWSARSRRRSPTQDVHSLPSTAPPAATAHETEEATARPDVIQGETYSCEPFDVRT